jgi:hypothetical protein
LWGWEVKKRVAKAEVVKAGGVTGGVALTREERRLLAPAGCRAYMRKTLVKEFPKIVKGFVDKAKTGSCPHVKMVTELMKPIRQVNPRQNKGPAARFIERLEKEDAERQEVASRKVESRAVAEERAGRSAATGSCAGASAA